MRVLRKSNVIVFLSIILIFLLITPAGHAATTGPESTSGTINFTPDMAVVLAIIFILLPLFIWEPVRLDLIALSIPVVLMVLEPWTKISSSEGLSGFSSPATITVLAMFVLSDAIRRTGFVQIIGDMLSDYFTGSENRQLALVTGLTSSVAGIINNTPVVAIFVPMVSRLARKANTSPSKLLMPLSYASMLGGTLTLLGTSTNLLASEISGDLINHSFSMFEFTKLGIVVLIVGIIYLLTVGRWLVPARIDPEDQLTEEYEMGNFLTEVVVEDESSLVGVQVPELNNEFDFDLVQIVRDGEKVLEPINVETIRKDDRLIIRSDRESLMKILSLEGLQFLPEVEVTQEKLEDPVEDQKLVEAVIPQGSFIEGETLDSVNFLDRYDATVLAVRRGEELTHRQLKDLEINAGDILLILVTEKTKKRLRQNANFILAQELETSDFRRDKIWIALGILLAVVGLAATGVVPIVVSSLAGIVGMVITGCLDPNEIYEAIDWEVIFLLSGLIPLGVAMQKTETARWLAQQILAYSDGLPVIVLLGIFYLFTAVMTNIVSNNASVVLMIPVAVDAALRIGVEPFSFVLAVTFAASTAFMSPVGYQTNLMVMGPGGYKFRDYLIVGAPLQILLSFVTPIGIVFFWGV